MNARVKAEYRWNVIRACGGAEFVKDEFRPVPAGREDEARTCDPLEIQPEAQPEPEQEAAPEKPARRKKGG